jgi:hypothetical protein
VTQSRERERAAKIVHDMRSQLAYYDYLLPATGLVWRSGMPSSAPRSFIAPKQAGARTPAQSQGTALLYQVRNNGY